MRSERGQRSFVNLSKAYLFWTTLKGANMSGAILKGANMSRANMSGASGITNEELEQQAHSLKGATMPNGQKYEDWLEDQ